ncbi:Eco57I restriction-modification methylase domain-containing protein [Sutterella sp.]|uniref:Eco57I restriction-modification methylase domain-containing protein n=1 Tax=Sutterella sp. TaxID=1981025 RepID=UPI003FD88140
MNHTMNNFTTCELQGKLFLHDQIQKAFVRKNERQKDEDYALPPGITIKEECSRSFRIAQSSWGQFYQQISRPGADENTIREATFAFAENLFKSALGYNFTRVKERMPVGDRGFAVHALVNDLPVVIVSGVALDELRAELAIENGGRSKKTAFQAIQEFLNASDAHTWGFAFNGRRVRLVRDAMSLTRPSYLEFNLEEIFGSESFSEYLQLWAVLHASRTTVLQGENVWDCWVRLGEENGQPVRDRLSSHVQEALYVLGNGFLAEPRNDALRDALDKGELSAEEYVHELLRLMYRFLFVFCLEERGLIHTEATDDAGRLAAERYQAGYSLHRYRDQSTKRRFANRYEDAWESVRIVFRALDRGEPMLALPALGGLFDADNCLWIDRSALSNKAFFEAMKLLRWATIDDVTAPIDYKNLGTEELGSVYEGLLELVPVVNVTERTLMFMGRTTANDRKSSGSYYTPDALVQNLIRTALDPVLKETLAKNPTDPVNALLGLRVIDPTCGSGHFLLAAARRIAESLALAQSPDGVVTPDRYRDALRLVIQHCIYGVDINPLAVELARMALWLEGFSRGKPLSFLDHHLKVGNTVVGVANVRQLQYGIARKAFKPLAGDDAAVCRKLGNENAQGLGLLIATVQDAADGNASLFDEDSMLDDLTMIESMPSETLEDERLKEEAYRRYLERRAGNALLQQCDVYMAAYLSPKTAETEALVPTTRLLGLLLTGDVDLGEEDRKRVDYAQDFCRRKKVFHWPVEFASVLAHGGFDCILGNPPWDKAKVEDKKWWAVRNPAIANAGKAADRKKMIGALEEGVYHLRYGGMEHYLGVVAESEKALFALYQEAQQQAAAASVYGHLDAKEGGRFSLTGCGDTNLYAYVAETMLNLRKPGGAIGIVVPPGLVTDDATKAFAQKVLDGQISNLYQFDNTEKIFPIDSRYSFALITFRESEEMECVFYASNVAHLSDPVRKVVFEKGDFQKFNPNTGTCLFVRTKRDLELCRKIYDNCGGVFVREDSESGNPWGLRTLRMFDMSTDSSLFLSTKESADCVPLFEGKMIHQYDSRFAGFVEEEKEGGAMVAEDSTDKDKECCSYVVSPRFFVLSNNVDNCFKDRFGRRFWAKKWMLAMRSISSPTNRRSVIASVLPSYMGAGNSISILLPNVSDRLASCLLANLNSIVVDYIDRIKQSGPNLNFFIIKQLPILTPNAFDGEDMEYISSRVARLTRNDTLTNKVWLTEYSCEKYQGQRRRLEITSELDAYFAHLYELTRADLQYILDPTVEFGDDYPSITFPGLKRDEIKEYGEYLTQRLVLEAYDKLAETRFAKA